MLLFHVDQHAEITSCFSNVSSVNTSTTKRVPSDMTQLSTGVERLSISEDSTAACKTRWDIRRVPSYAVPSVKVIRRYDSFRKSLTKDEGTQLTNGINKDSNDIGRKRSTTNQTLDFSESDLGIASAATSPQKNVARMVSKSD